MSQNHNAVPKIQHQIYTTNDNIHNYVQNKSGGQSVQILILEGHISELKQDPILYVYFYHMLSYMYCYFQSSVAKSESHFNACNLKVSKIFSKISGMELTPRRKRTPKEQQNKNNKLYTYKYIILHKCTRNHNTKQVSIFRAIKCRTFYHL